MSEDQPQPSPQQPFSISGTEVISFFNQLYYDLGDQTWQRTSWLGVPTLKCPTDLWVYQEIVWHIRPRFILETGTCYGGTSLFLAHMLDLCGGDGRIVSVDLEPKSPLPPHPRLTYITGSSTDPKIVEQMHQMAREATAAGGSVMVILDSDHSREHVLAELRAYHDIVTPGSYLIVEDTNVNGHPVYPDHGPGPMEAVEEFMRDTRDFQIDKRCERFLVTFNPSGFLRKRDARPSPS